MREAENEDFNSEIKISYELYQSYNSETVQDSSSKIVKIKKPANGEEFFHSGIIFSLPSRKNYILQLTLEDLKRNKMVQSFIEVNKQNDHVKENFKVTYKQKNTPVHKNYLKQGEVVSIEYIDKSVDVLIVKYFNDQFPLPAPPYDIQIQKNFSPQPDSIYHLSKNESGGFLFQVLQPGLYQIQRDSSQSDGLTFYYHYDAFPNVNSMEEILKPIVFLTSRTEFNNISQSENVKLALDEFWLGNAGNKRKAKELISNYYKRVQTANILFSSYTQGWKTDRGMIYLIFGQPNFVYKNASSENWTYGEENNALSITFTFIKMGNPFSDNDYSLHSSPIYKNSWYRAVETWRQGRVYFD